MKRKSENLFETKNTAKNISQLSIRFPDHNLENYGTFFLNFKNLKTLFLQSDINNIGLIPNDVGELKSLTHLEILNFNYKELPQWILKLPKLEKLLFRGHNIEVLPDSISQLKNLKSLRLENCVIKELPKSMSTMNRLVHLSLADNFNLKTINTNALPLNLKELIITPSNLPQHEKETIRLNRPGLKIT